MFSGSFLLSHNTVNELCYVAQLNKNSPLYVVNSKILYENDDILKNG
jgi:hypothetical protein